VVSRLTEKGCQEAWRFLINLGQNYELDVIKGILSEADVPVLTKSKGAGAYTNVCMGMSNTGYDLYVPASRLAEARKLLNETEPIEFIEINEPEDTADQTGGYILKHRNLFKKVFIIVFIIPSLLGLLFVLLQQVTSFF
jgi:hypothetical protein